MAHFQYYTVPYVLSGKQLMRTHVSLSANSINRGTAFLVIVYRTSAVQVGLQYKYRQTVEWLVVERVENMNQTRRFPMRSPY